MLRTLLILDEAPDPTMEDIISNIAHILHNLQLEPVDDYHISLTKTLILRHHWIDSFVDTVRKKLQFFRT